MTLTKEIQVVRPCDWYGVQGWCCDGWAGETKEEAVMEMCIRDAEGDIGAASDRFQNIEIVEGD
ncbi:MAG: hypothetical protein ACOY9J_13500 [Pseudomonadota bacterium]